MCECCEPELSLVCGPNLFWDHPDCPMLFILMSMSCKCSSGYKSKEQPCNSEMDVGSKNAEGSKHEWNPEKLRKQRQTDPNLSLLQ